MQPWLRSFIAYAPDDGAGAATAVVPDPPASPEGSARARIDAAVEGGMRDEGAGQPEVAPVVPGAEGTPAPAGGDDLDLDSIDFQNLPYQQGKRIEAELRKSRERYRPFEQAFGGLPDNERAAAIESLGALGENANETIGLVAGMAAQDRDLLFGAYAQAIADPGAGAQEFLRIAQALATGAGITLDPAAPAPAPAGTAQPGAQPAPASGEAAGTDDLDRPMTRREFQAEQQRLAAERTTGEAEAAAQQQILTDVRALGYDPDSSDQDERSRSDEVIWLAAYRTGGDIKKADAILKGREQVIIDRYRDQKRADASRPATPDNGSSPSGAREPGQVAPKDAARERILAAFGPPPASSY